MDASRALGLSGRHGDIRKVFPRLTIPASKVSRPSCPVCGVALSSARRGLALSDADIHSHIDSCLAAFEE